MKASSSTGAQSAAPVHSPPTAQPDPEAPASTSAPSTQFSAPPGLQARAPLARSQHEHSSSRRVALPALESNATAALSPRTASGRFTGAGSSPLLPPQAHGRSDHFEPLDIDAALAADSHAVESQSSRRSNPLVPSPTRDASPDEVVIDIDPPAAAATLHEQIVGALGRLQFAAPPGPMRDAQVQLEHEYIPWAAGVADKRKSAFGGAHYSIGGNHQKNFGEAVLPAVFDFGRQFISSSSRSPIRNALATKFAPRYTEVAGQRVNIGEFTNSWDAALLGGAVGGVTAHAVDSTLLTAMDREARRANMPQLKPVDLKALVPDPGAVQLSIVDGKKVYWRPTDDVHADLETGAGAAAGRPSKTQLEEEVKVRRQALASVQDALEAKNWGLFAQPLVTGAFNMARRVLMPAASLLQPTPVLLASIAASGTAGAVTKLGLGLLKPTAQAHVNDLVGGQQQVNLFATKLPDASQAPARFADIGRLPGRAKSALRETAALGAHFVAGPWRDSGSAVPSRDASLARIGDVMRAVTANTLASVFSTATGPLVASVAREGLTAPLPGEAKDSPAYLLQQVATSATNDYVWQASKEAHKNSAFDLAGSLDRWRARADRPHGE
jgi:hypothetical protein